MVAGNHYHLDPPALQLTEGAHHGVVFHTGGDHPIAGSQQTEKSQIERVRGVQRENDAKRVTHAQQFSHCLAPLQYDPTGGNGEAVSGSPRVAARFSQEGRYGCGYLRRLGPRGGCMVQVG